MEHDYSQLIENLKERRYDEALHETVLSDGFKHSDYSDCIKYALESMMEIDASYAYKVYNNSKRIHDRLSKELQKRNVNVEYRYQGALKTYSDIHLYGEVEIIVIGSEVSDKPYEDIQSLGSELMDILNGFEFKTGDFNFKLVDFSDKTRIRITALKPTCKINVLPTIWVNNEQYLTTKNEIYRGIAEFDFIDMKVRKYLPFLNIARVNARNWRTDGNSSALYRLVSTLCKDKKEPIKLKDYELTGLMYAFPEGELKVPNNQVLSLLPKLESFFSGLITNEELLNEIPSPSKKERIFRGKPEKKEELTQLKKSLSSLVSDLEKGLAEKNLTIRSEIPYE